MKKILKYIIVFIVTVLILFLSLVASSSIPRKAIEKNINKSVDFYKNVSGINAVKNGRIDTYIHYYADTRKMNIINSMDSKDPIKATLWSKYYLLTHMDSNIDFIYAVKDNKAPNSNYLRYWNGCMLFLRPLLIFFDIVIIYSINKILLLILLIILLIMLFKRSKKLAIIFLLSLILTSSWYVGYCIEYSVMFYVMFITSILALKIDKKSNDMKKSNEKLCMLFFITGIVTTFFDFLTTEILTIFVPLLFILIIRKEENRLEGLKSTLIFILKSCILWFIGYSLMWLTKWVLSSLILGEDISIYVKKNLMLRVNSLQGLSSKKELYLGAIRRNIFTIPFMYYIKENITNWKTLYFITVFILILLVFTNWKELKNKKYLLPLLFIGITPYLRYLAIANHSYRHIMFTFRDQIITLIVIIYIIVDCFNYKLLFKKVDISTPLKSKKVKK